MFHRSAETRLLELLRDFPAVGLLGPRQVGKTTLAFSVADTLQNRAVYLDLELPSDQAKLADAELYLSHHEDKLVILDEIHRLPGIFQTLRGLIDRRRRRGDPNGHFLLLGSASIDMLQQSSETLAGRIAYEELPPLTLAEVGNDEERLWLRGGFPDSFLARNDAASLRWRTAFINTYLERDVPDLGPRIPAETLHRFWQMLAHNQGQLLNSAQIAMSLGVTGVTVARYLDVMVDLLLVRRLQPWVSNAGKRLVRSPKVYVRDSGMTHALLNIRNMEELLGHPVAGGSWEGMLIENILDRLPHGASGHFYRTSAGAEIDLVLQLNPKERWAIEIKRSISDPRPSKGFHIACDDIKATRRVVLYPGKEAFPLSADVEVSPLGAFLKSMPKEPGKSPPKRRPR